MKNIFALVSISILLLQVFPVAAAEPPATTPSFVQLCSLKNSLPAATKQTIDILLKKAGIENRVQRRTDRTKIQYRSIGIE